MASQSSFAYLPKNLQQFNNTGHCQECDLTNATIKSEVNAPYNLQGANIASALIDLHSAVHSNFSKIIGIRTKFNANNTSYAQADFKNSVLIQANLAKADLTNTNFTNANLSYANVENTDFTGANVTGVIFTGADLLHATGINFSEVASVCGAIMPSGSIGLCK